MSQVARSGRVCSRVSCRNFATSTLTYIYAESTAVIGQLATFSEPHSYDLCESHGKKLTVPNGWTVIKEENEISGNGPSVDDLMAIADAVREVAMSTNASNSDHISASAVSNSLGRRGHLRAVPTNNF